MSATTTASSPLGPEQIRQLREATERAKGFLGAAAVAGFNGWTFAIFAALTLASGLSSMVNFLVGLGLALVARNEFKGRSLVAALDPSGLQLLWRNQIGLMALIVAYCLWSMFGPAAAPDPDLAQMNDLLHEALGPGGEEIVEQLTLLVYGSTIAATVLCQGLNARYYQRRVALLQAHLQLTPDWVLGFQRSGGSYGAL